MRHRKTRDTGEIPVLSFPRSLTIVFYSFILSGPQLCSRGLFHTRSLSYQTNFKVNGTNQLISFLVPLTSIHVPLLSRQILERKRIYFVKLLSYGVTFNLHRHLHFCNHGGRNCFGDNTLPLEIRLFSPVISNVCEFILVSNDSLVSPTQLP